MREGFRWCLMSESLSDAVREAAQGEAERKVAAVREECGWASDDAAWYRHGFAQGAVWVAGRLPSRDEIALAIAKTMPGWNEDTEDGDLTSHWERVNATCIESGGSYADAILALIREHVTRG